MPLPPGSRPRRTAFHLKGKMKTGADYLGGGRCSFSVWAPFAEGLGLKLIGLDGNRRHLPMHKDRSGYWKVTAVDVRPGFRYSFVLDGRERADPASHSQPSGVDGPSEVIDHSEFAWHDSRWGGIALRRMIIYEVHTGTFTPEGTLEAIIPRLDELKGLGINAIELMPLSQFPGDRNWGYDGVFPFAVQNSYGGPEGLKKLVNECHKKDVSVILDAVYNHFGPEGNYISEFGPYFTEMYKGPWGSAINFDGPGSDNVREFFIENALHWFRHYHIDALRLDAVHAILDFSAIPFLKALSNRVREFSKKSGRRHYLIAECDRNDSSIAGNGGCSTGLDAQWCDDFHHSVHALLTGERTGYYADFGKVRHLVKSLNEGYAYTGQYSAYRQRRFGSPSAHVPKDRFIVFTQNHDQVGNRMLGERLSTLIPFEGLKLAAGILLLSPYVPLIFMGEEYAEAAPFLYFASHTDESLIASVREGRKSEFREFLWETEPPEPQSPQTYDASRLGWDQRNSGRHNVLLNMYKRLIGIRSGMGALSDPAGALKAWGLEEEMVIFMTRASEGSGVFSLFSFNRSPVTLELPFPGGRWVKALDSSDEAWEGPGSDLPGVAEGKAVSTVNGLSFAVYIKEGG